MKNNEIINPKELVGPVNYILTYLCDDEIEISVAQYYYARYKLALRNKTRNTLKKLLNVIKFSMRNNP